MVTKRNDINPQKIIKLNLNPVYNNTHVASKSIKDLYFSTSVIQSQRESKEVIFQTASKNIMNRRRLLSEESVRGVRSVLSFDSRAS
jgi:hypothetical protein